MVRRAVAFVQVRTDAYSYDPRDAILQLYRPTVWLALGFVVFGFLKLGVGLFVGRGERLALLFAPEHLLVLTTLFTIIILALTEQGEEARFTVSVLPLLAALPRVNPGTRGRWVLSRLRSYAGRRMGYR
jgi:hypothetical protein